MFIELQIDTRKSEYHCQGDCIEILSVLCNNLDIYSINISELQYNDDNDTHFFIIDMGFNSNQYNSLESFF